MPSLTNLIKEVPRINTFNKQILDDQWRGIHWHQFPESVRETLSDAGAFYKKIIEFEDDDGCCIF